MTEDAAAEAQGNTDAGEATEATTETTETTATEEGNFLGDAAEGGEGQKEETGTGGGESKADEGENFLADDADAETTETKEGEETKEDAKTEGVPEAYEFKMPEGVEEDKALTAAISPVLKDLGLTQEQAQGLVDVYAAQQQAQAEASAQAFKDFEANEQREMREAVRAIPDYKNVVLNAKVAADFMAQTDEEKAYLNEDGNNPVFLKMMARLGDQLGEGKFVEGDGGAGELSDAEKLDRAYPSMRK